MSQISEIQLIEDYSLYTPRTLRKTLNSEMSDTSIRNYSDNCYSNDHLTSREAKKMQYYMTLFERAERREAKKERRKKVSPKKTDSIPKTKGGRGRKRKATNHQTTPKLNNPVKIVENEWENVEIRIVTDDNDMDQDLLSTFYNSGSNYSNSNYQELEGMSSNGVNTPQSMSFINDKVGDLLSTPAYLTNASCI